MPALELSVDRADLDRRSEAIITAMLLAGTRSIHASTKWLERRLEDQTKRSVKGRLWRAWKSDAYPAQGRPAYAPEGQVYVNGGKRSIGAMAYWTKPGINKKASGEWLAIPTPEAGVLGRNRNITPGEWERRNGIRLEYVHGKDGKPSRLVAEHVMFGANGIGVRVPTKKRLRNQRYINRDGSPARVQSVTIFVLIPFQRFANKVAVDPIVRQAEAYLAKDYRERTTAVGRRFSA